MYMQENYNFEKYKPIIENYITFIRPTFLADKAKSFIENQYLDLYNAKISVSYPYLAYINENKTILCSAGFRFAKTEHLFLEQYLDKPIENYTHTIREKIVEVGNLATKDYTKFFKLLYELSIFLMDNDIEYIAITATNKLYRTLHKRGISGEYLADANQESLKNNSIDWGSYYSTEPKVYLFNLQENISALKAIVKTSNKRLSA